MVPSRVKMSVPVTVLTGIFRTAWDKHEPPPSCDPQAVLFYDNLPLADY